ncbi:ABC transporter permease [Lactobacillus sp. CBA3606]|uniref:ABC transporter permease n=1 Tax=Lactobacillus sp. CBA3606 TaxID=2099789 RepID=UPI000CFCFCA8|nr:ABC transporter permease [Lactobacillus sp. CBA3606]AVK63761.1 ABC transporter permease [Lactobacillus sp. CBA3606]
MAWLGLIVFIIALIGYSGTARYLGVSPYLSWITAMLVQILLLYVFAMLGWLRLGIWLVTGLGWLLFAVRIIFGIRGKGRLKFEGLHIFDLWMITLGLAMADVLYHSPLIHYDNFSHWALIVKFLVFEGRLPGAHDAIISFTSYPPATALYLTQFTTLVGFHDGTLLVGQFLLIWAASYAIFGLLRDRTRGLMSLILCFSIAVTYVFNIAIRLNNLLVDYVLPIFTIAALVGIYIYRKQPKLLGVHVAIFTATLLLVKNSATFFVIIIGVYYLYTLIKSTNGLGLKRWWRILYRFGLSLGIGLLPFLWWERHVHQTFTVSKHEISATAYRQQLSTEGTAKILKVGHKMISQLFNLNSLSVEGILLINATLIIGWLLIRFVSHQHSNLLGILGLIDLIFITYFASLFGMYALSMPYSEAIVLDGYERYMSSTVILNLLIGAMALVRAMDYALYEQRFERRSLRTFKSIFTKNFYQMATFIVLIFAIIMMFSEINGTNYANRYNRNTLPQQMKRIAQPWYHYSRTKVLIVDPHAGDVASYYTGFVAHYYFFTNHATGQENFMESPTDFAKNVQRYDYLAIPEYHHTFSVMVKKVYHQKVRTGLFRITRHGLKKISATATIGR